MNTTKAQSTALANITAAQAAERSIAFLLKNYSPESSFETWGIEEWWTIDGDDTPVDVDAIEQFATDFSDIYGIRISKTRLLKAIVENTAFA